MSQVVRDKDRSTEAQKIIQTLIYYGTDTTHKVGHRCDGCVATIQRAIACTPLADSYTMVSAPCDAEVWRDRCAD